MAESGKWVWELMQSVGEYFRALTLHPVLRAGDTVAPLSPVFTVTELTLQGDGGGGPDGGHPSSEVPQGAGEAEQH